MMAPDALYLSITTAASANNAERRSPYAIAERALTGTSGDTCPGKNRVRGI